MTYGPPSLAAVQQSSVGRPFRKERETIKMIELLNRAQRSTFALLISGMVPAICATMPDARPPSGGELANIGGIFSTTGFWELL